MRILLVEDNGTAARFIAKGLREAAYAVDVAADGERATALCAENAYDAVILDVMLPRKDGFAVCRELRGSGADVPILIVTAKDAVESRVEGLDAGADGYLTKPFDFRELLARLRAMTRRDRRPVLPPRVTVGCMSIDLPSRRVWISQREITLTSREFALLSFLAQRANEVVGRAEIAEHVWDAQYDPLSNVVDVYVQRLRRKIDSPGTDSLIRTRRGDGYQLVGERS